MIIKRLFSIEKWQTYKVNQLRVELKSRNLPISGIKAQLIQRMVDYENNLNKEKADNENPEIPIETSQDAPKITIAKKKTKEKSLSSSALKDYTQPLSIDKNKPFLFVDHPDPYIQSVLNRQKLSEELDFTDFLKYLEMSDENITFDENLWKLIDGLSKLYQISLYNCGVIKSIDHRKLKKFLQKIPLSSLDSNQGVKILKAITTIENLDHKFIEESDKEWLLLIFSHIIKSTNDINLLDMTFLKWCRPHSLEIPPNLFINMCDCIREKFLNASNFNNYTEQELLFILRNLPWPYFSTNIEAISLKISEMVSLLSEKLKKINSLDALLALRTMDAYGSPIPTQLLIEINKMKKEDLIKKPSDLDLAMDVCFILHYNKCLTVDFLNGVINRAENFIDIRDREGILLKTAEFFYKLSQSRPNPPKIELKQFIKKVLDLNEDQYSANILMLLAISSLEVDAKVEDLSLDLVKKLVFKLQESPEAYHSLRKKLLWKIISMVKEGPIFNYQISSSLEPINEEIKTLSFELLKSLKYNNNIVHEFYLSKLADTIPSLEILTRNQKTLSVDSYSKLIWVYQAHLSPEMLLNAIYKSLDLLDKNNISPETLFYLSSLHNQLFRSKKISRAIINDQRKRILDFAQNFGEYSFAIQYNLAEAAQKSMRNDITLARYQTLYGEALVNTIIMLSKIGEYKTAARLSENLSYIQNKSPPILKSAIKELVIWLDKLASYDLKYEPISIFLANYLNDENADLVRLISQFIAKYAGENDISLEFKEKYEEIKANLSGETKPLEQEEEINFAEIDINYETLPILQTLLTKRIFKNNLPQQFSNLLKNTTDVEKLLEIIKAILDYLSVIGDNEKIADEIYNKIDSLKLWPKVPQEVIANLLFLNLENIDNFPELVTKFLFAIYAGEPPEYPIINPITNMFCYQAFLFKSVLEPRYVQSNYKPITNLEIYKMTNSLITYNSRVHAILNALKQNPTEESLEAAACLYGKSSRREFKYEFFKYLRDSQRLKKEAEGEIQDPVTKWRADVIFLKYKTVVLYVPDEFVVYDENGEEVGMIYIIRVIQEQFEKIGGLRCVTVKGKTWKEMDNDVRKEYVQNLGIGLS